MNLPSPQEAFARQIEQNTLVVGESVPRNHKDQPMIAPAPGDEHLAYKSGPFKGLVPYSRASSFGDKIDDTFNLQKWQQRQVARGMGVLLEQGKVAAGASGGMPGNPLVEPTADHEKRGWDGFVERCHEAAKSNAKADIGTAIHYGTEVVDLDGDLDQLAPEVRERAEAYARARNEWGWIPTSVEEFGVEDQFHVAGTWDRIMWFGGRLCIGDVKTSTSLKWSGIKFAVQLWIYSRSKVYDHVTRTRTPHDERLDLERAWIIHVDRNPGGPVTVHPVDLVAGGRWVLLTQQIIEARREGKGGIGDALDVDLQPLLRCTTRDQLVEVMTLQKPSDPKIIAAANELWKVLP